jgi:hypothetical protein
MTDKAWKRSERQIAERLGSKRNPNDGSHKSDINTETHAVEVKTRKTLPAWLKDAVAQSKRAAKVDETPIVVLAEVRQGVAAKRYVVMDFDDFTDWYV